MIDNDFQKFAQTEKARRNRKNSKFKKSEGVNFDVKFRTEELTERKLGHVRGVEPVPSSHAVTN